MTSTNRSRIEVPAAVRVFDGSLLYARGRWQIWMRTLRICSLSFDRGPGRADNLSIFFSLVAHSIVRDVQRPVFDFCFDYAPPPLRLHQLFPFLGRHPEIGISIRATIVSLTLGSVRSGSIFVLLKTLRARVSE